MRDWPKVKMDGIRWHWSGGAYTPSHLDLSHYHFAIDGNGIYYDGVPIEYNAPPLVSGKYAAHTRGNNSRMIGISCCSMGGALERGPYGKWPLLERQIETLITLSVALCHFYEIPVSDKRTMSHAEVQPNLGIKQNGKWDIAVFPFAPEYNTAKKCGDYIRKRVAAGLAVQQGQKK
jgi:N-acetyl-anhydromuramyl-L-alanine amidase AmpD